tara:strand:- start:2336 stop:2623 length:288 start_codon:yes stop_codon:yes gene_type:complete
MDTYELDLESVEEALDLSSDQKLVLGFLDGVTPESEWINELELGNVLILQIKGELETLIQEIAPYVKDKGGTAMRFREFLILSPPNISVDNTRLS